MKSGITILLSLALALFTIAGSYASEERMTEPQALKEYKLLPAAKSLQITGGVKAVSISAGTITVTKKFKDETLEVIALVDNETRILKGNEKKSLHDINAGDNVVVVYTKKDEKNLAKSISLK